MHCSQCGQSIAPGARFCPNCGASIAAPPYTASYSVPTRALIRPRHGRIVAGVCAAFARTYGWNVTLIRILLVVLTPFHLGLGFIAYLVAWIVIPEEPYLIPSATPPPAPTS